MARTQSAGRNDLCSCGSGKKYKKCCSRKNTGSWASRSIAVAVLAIVVGALVVIVMSFGENPAAPGAAGKVWSQEHGHYH